MEWPSLFGMIFNLKPLSYMKFMFEYIMILAKSIMYMRIPKKALHFVTRSFVSHCHLLY